MLLLTHLMNKSLYLFLHSTLTRLKSLPLLLEKNLVRDSPLLFRQFLISNLMEKQEILIYHHLVLTIFHYPQALKLMANEQIEVLGNHRDDIINNVVVMIATVLGLGLHAMFLANGHQQYLANDR